MGTVHRQTSNKTKLKGKAMKISEWVSTGHPDKMADHISEYLLDRFIEQDPNTRFALEVQVKDNIVTIGGEVTTTANVEIEPCVKAAIRSIGYTDTYWAEWTSQTPMLIPRIDRCINPDDVVVNTYINKQSSDIAQGVDQQGWGDQGIMFGMATNKTEYDFMPKDFYLARKIGKTLYKHHKEYGIGIDIKTQVVLAENDTVKKIIVAAPMKTDAPKAKIEEFIRKMVGDCEIIINGTGAYVTHSSIADCGTTGRKLAVDFYGGNCQVGGGSPWTKDGTKADLALNLYARYLAVQYVLEHPEYPKVFVKIGCCIGQTAIDITYVDEDNVTIFDTTEEMPTNKLIEKFRLREPNFAALNKEGLFTIVDKLAIEDWKNTQPAGC
jgi:S-adenosylmethionine synthetase